VVPSARTEPADSVLVASASAGVPWAYELLFARYAGVVHGLACRLLGSDDEADDVVQNTFIVAFGSLDRLENPAAVRSWLCGIAVRRTAKLIRRRRLLRRLGLLAASSFDVEPLLSSDAPPDVVAQLRAVYSLLEHMPADLRTVFLLRRVEGSTIDEIATLTRASPSTVKRRLAKAEARFRVLLQTARP